MMRIIRLPLVRPLPIEPLSEKDVMHANSTPVVEVDLYEGTVRLPDGTIVLADSWVRVARAIQENMQKWAYSVSGQQNPLSI